MILGLLIGVVLNLFFPGPGNGIEIYPEWTGNIGNIRDIEKAPNLPESRLKNFIVKHDKYLYLLGGDGRVLNEVQTSDSITALSGNGKYYIKYPKLSKEIEFHNIAGERFWRMKSKEYPYLSYNARMIFLMNSDHSSVRIVDHNGNEIGAKEIIGRLCTVLSFSEITDFGGLGFLDGSFYILNESGKTIYEGITPAGNAVKGISISSNGVYASVHYGGVEKDHIRIINIQDSEYENVGLKNVHTAKTSIYVTNNGYVTVNDVDNILCFSDSGSMEYNIRIPKKRYGSSTIGYNNGIYSATYTKTDGESKLILYKDNGSILLSKTFPDETFLNASLKSDLIFLRGSDNLYCYRIRQ